MITSAGRVRLGAGIVLMFFCACAGTEDWDILEAGLWTGTLKTDWRESRLVYQLQIEMLKSDFKPDSVPTQALLRFYDDDDFEVLRLEVPLTYSGTRRAVYANAAVDCPREGGLESACSRVDYRRAKRWTLLPYAFDAVLGATH